MKTIGGREKPHEHPCRLQARRTVADRQGLHMGSRLSHLSGPATDRLWRPRSLPRHRIQRVLNWIHLAGFDEMDEVSGDGSAELLDDGTIEVEFAYHNGDEALLKASGPGDPLSVSATASSDGSDRARGCSGGAAQYDRGMALFYPRTRRVRGQKQRWHLLPRLFRTANGRILRLIF